MGKEKHIEKQQTKERRRRVDLNIWDIILLVFIVVYVILLPAGGFDFFCGWYNPYLIFYSACFVLPIMLTIGILLLIFTAIWTLRLFVNWTKYTRRKKFIKIIHICIPLVFIGSLYISVFIPIDIPFQFGYTSFTYGFRERIRGKADIDEIRNWLETLKEEDCSGETIGLYRSSDPLISHWPDTIEWTESLKVFNPHYVYLGLDENRNPKVSLTWGGPFAHWGVVIGMEDMEIPPSDLSRFGEYRLPLQPGVYVWHELQ